MKNFKFDNYHKALFGKTKDELQQMVEMNTLRSYLHEMYAIKMKKVGLCALDDKRYVCDDLIDTKAHGHHLITA